MGGSGGSGRGGGECSGGGRGGGGISGGGGRGGGGGRSGGGGNVLCVAREILADYFPKLRGSESQTRVVKTMNLTWRPLRFIERLSGGPECDELCRNALHLECLMTFIARKI